MEASGAGPAAAAAPDVAADTSPLGGQPAQQQQQQAPQADGLTPETIGQLNSLAGLLPQLQQGLEQRDDGQEYDDGEEHDDGYQQAQFDPYTGEPLAADDGNPQEAEQVLDQFVNERVQQVLDQQLRPIMDRFAEQDADNLVQQYPDLGKAEVVQQVSQAAQAVARQMGQPDSWRSPAFMEQAYLAMKAREMLASEVPGQQQETGIPLESGGSAPQQESDPAWDIYNAGGSQEGSIFG